MAAAEKNYSACVREALAVICSLIKFRLHLVSTEPFVIETYHRELSYYFHRKAVHGRLDLFLDFIAKYEFAVKYRTNKGNQAAECLSRQPNRSQDD